MAGNTLLSNARTAKNDEFYTQLADIEKEIRHYKAHFNGKVVLCNCDDPFESNFFKYFAMNFNSLGLKKLIATCYATSPIVYTQLNMFGDEIVASKEESTKKPYKIEITEVTDENNDGRIDLADVEYLLKNRKNALTLLQGDGDFRSPECVELLKQADIVVTNPPFSLFREYVAHLMEYEKSFLIIGNQNAITYKEIFPLLKNNKMWIGYGFSRNCAHFLCPYPTYSKWIEMTKEDFEKQGIEVPEDLYVVRVTGVMWFTNLDIEKRHEDLTLFRTYTPEEYPKYDNYDAIEVSKTADIPCDYYGVMGVPITFMNKYSPEQFEIIGATESEGKGFSNGLWRGGIAQSVVNGKRTYKRLFIKRKGATA